MTRPPIKSEPHHDLEWVDFHCHVDLYPAPDQIAYQAEQSRVCTLAVTTTPRAWPREREMFANLKFVQPALGLHPELVAERAAELNLWERYLEDTRYVGEVGLDARPRARSSLAVQKMVFKRILEICAERGGKILTVHSAAIPGDTVQMIVDHLPPDRGRVVLHWFTGTRKIIGLAAAHNCYFSINASMLKSHTARQLLSAIPHDRILTETDGPFTEVGRAAARPVDVPKVVVQLAHALNLAPDNLAEQIRTNLRRLLS